MKDKLILVIRLIALPILYFICFAIVSGALFPAAAQAQSAEQANAAVALFVVSCLSSAVLAYLILRSRWAGVKLIVSVFLVFFGIATFMPQIETAYFVTRLPPGILPRIFLAGAIVAALFSPLAVLLLGKRKQHDKESRATRLHLTKTEWAWKAGVIILLYVIIYFTFGYFIAWQSAAVRAYYGGSDPGNFLTQMSNTLRTDPGLFGFQAVRALLWTAIAVLVIRMLKGGWVEAALTVALLFTLLFSPQLLIPNEYMPRDVRMAHLLETATSNFLFGALVVLVLFSGTSLGKVSKPA
ncbi:MAG TPA: hypothetical protein VKB46_05040 [Pyrinomonadaceae bacterium]|nr:hypothetical protein [Pyrinomonadaceae bacterium]